MASGEFYQVPGSAIPATEEATEEAAEEGTEGVRIRPDLKRLAEMVTVGDYFELREGNLDLKIEVLSQFVVEDGAYLGKEEGRERFKKVKLSQVVKLFERFMSETEEFAVPLGNGRV